MKKEIKKGVCQICQCTDNDCSSCIRMTEEPCSWANDSHTLCTACSNFLKKVDEVSIATERFGRIFNSLVKESDIENIFYNTITEQWVIEYLFDPDRKSSDYFDSISEMISWLFADQNGDLTQ